MSFLHQIDSSWTLFLDRDGVINLEKEKDYIRHVSEFVFYPHVAEHFHLLNSIFTLIVVVTNQRGIGKGLMTVADLHDIHSYLQTELNKHGGHIDQFYFAPDLENDAMNRKPNIGMGLQAKEEFPQIDFSKSIMVGNNISDMEFGKNLGMKTIYLNTTSPREDGHPMIDIMFDNLYEFIQNCSPPEIS